MDAGLCVARIFLFRRAQIRPNQHMDCLSRYPVDPPDTDACVFSILEFLHFGDEQRRDLALRSILYRISSEAPDESLA